MNKNTTTKTANKTAKKVTVLNAQTLEALHKELATLKTKGETAHNNDIARAKSLYKIKSEELFKCEGNCDNFKEWYNKYHDGTLYGITYKTACILINTYKNVWTVKEFKTLPLAIACRLASICKDEAKRDEVKRLVKEGKITPNTSQRAVNTLLKDEGLMQSKTAVAAQDSTPEEVLEALARVNKYLNDTCKDKSILAQWAILKEALNKEEK